MVTGRRRSPENPTLDFGFVMPAMLTPEMSRSCVDYAKAIVALLNLDFGVFHLEMAITPDGPVLIECNTRLMGANLPLMYLSLSGIDLYEHVIRMFLGEAPPLPPATVTGGIASSSVIVSRDGHTAKDFTVDWRQPYVDRIIRIYLDQNPEPDKAVEAGLNFGGFHVRGENSADAYAVVGKLLDNFEAVTGVSVYK